MSDQSQELMRIRKEYAQRDEQGISEIYSYSNPAFVFHMQERERAILNLLKQEKIDLSQSNILDVGCGTGHVLQRFLDFGAKEGTGIDLMESRLRMGKDQYPRLRLFQGNAAQLPFRENEFDFVMQFMCFSSVLDSAMRQKVADEMWRVLRPGGVILFYDLCPRSFWLRLSLKVNALPKKFRIKNSSEEKPRMLYSTPTQPMSQSEIRELFQIKRLQIHRVSLDFKFASFAYRLSIMRILLSWIPFLKTHYLALIRKPA